MILPFKLGKSLPMSLADPVVVGIIDKNAERRSLVFFRYELSSKFCESVTEWMVVINPRLT